MSFPRDVYIAGTGSFLPNDPVSNERITDYLSSLDTKLDSVRRGVLRQNGIQQRYYALDRNAVRTHTNAEMVARAMFLACMSAEQAVSSVQFLSAGTSLGDVLIPSFAQMCHGYLARHGINSIHVHPVQGVCCASMHALEAAHAFLSLGKYETALVGAGERASVAMRSAHFSEEFERQAELAANNDGYSYFHAEFLRYMLSDGAGGLFLTNKRPSRYSFKVNWIETVSYANALPTCMYLGDHDPDGFRPGASWMANDSLDVSIQNGLLNLRQNTDILKEHIIKQSIQFTQSLIDRELLDFAEVEVAAIHLSSMFFLNELRTELDNAGIDLPTEKIYTNLKTVGNIGSGASFVLLDSLFKSQRLKPGQSGFLFVPESAKFAFSAMHFTAVE